MVTPTISTTPANEQGTNEMPLQLAALLAAMANADVEQAKARQAIVRENFRSRLADLHAETGTKTVDVTLPDGRKIGTASFSETKDATKVISEDKLTEWILEHDEWETKVETVTRIQPTFLTRLLKDVVWIPRTETKAKFEWVDVTDDDGNVLNADGQPVKDGEEPDQMWVPVLDGDGVQVEEEQPVLDDNGEPNYDAIYGPTGELVPGLTLVKGETDTSKFTIRTQRAKAGAATVAGVTRDGGDLLAEFMSTTTLASMIPEEIEAPVVDGK